MNFYALPLIATAIIFLLFTSYSVYNCIATPEQRSVLFQDWQNFIARIKSKFIR